MVDVLFGRPMLGVLAGEVGLKEDLRFGAGLGGGRVEPLQQIQESIEWMTANGARRLAGLVGLQMADQVPSGAGRPAVAAIFCSASWTLFSPKSR